MFNVTIGFASGAMTAAEFTKSLAILTSYHSEKYNLNQILNVQGSLIDQSRNELVRQFLMTTQSDWLLMLDTDLSFSENIIDQLLDMAEETKSKICAGWYNVRVNVSNHMSSLSCVYKFIDEYLTHVIITKEFEPKYIKIDAVGAGLLMIHRSVFQDFLSKGLNYFFKFDHINGQTVTEDIYFCRKAKELNHDIYVNKDVYGSHYKLQAI